ncbi:MAG: MGMT family protein [Ktedonobacterales bacterium]
MSDQPYTPSLFDLPDEPTKPTKPQAPASQPPQPTPAEPLTRDGAALLSARVYALVKACPSGRVTTYGWIGAALGYPRGARMIGWIMNEAHEGGIPAQRVVSAKGELTGSWAFGQRGRMRQLLEAEGVPFDAADHIDMKRYGWNPGRDLAADELQRILDGADPASLAVSDHLLALLLDDPASPFRIAPSTEV